MNRLHTDTCRALNRSAIVVRPAQPFLDWLHEADSTSARIGLQDLRHEPTVYLLPETNSSSDFERVIRKSFDTIFTAELEGWLQDESAWPAKRTLGMFRAWFETSIHSMLIDLADTDLSYD